MILVLFSSCYDPPVLFCGADSLNGFDKGDLVVTINDLEINYRTSHYRSISTNHFITFSHEHISNCHYDWKLSCRMDKDLLFQTNDTIFFKENTIRYFYNRSSDTGGASYQNELDDRNWLLIKEVNQDSTAISGEFEFRVIDSSGIQVTLNDIPLPDTYEFKNAVFTSELLEI